MQDGMRDGRGICLYNNNNLYEGEYKKNREHGIGTLMTSDWKRIIYEGAWEKGRMHGHGVYYYYSEVLGGGRGGVVVVVEGVSVVRDHLHNSAKVCAMDGACTHYPTIASTTVNSVTTSRMGTASSTGQFRQSLCNGRGVYTLPNGSFYDGEFCDNIQNGFGIFHWTNGSIY
jgi:hypothetical protein